MINKLKRINKETTKGERLAEDVFNILSKGKEASEELIEYINEKQVLAKADTILIYFLSRDIILCKNEPTLSTTDTDQLLDITYTTEDTDINIQIFKYKAIISLNSYNNYQEISRIMGTVKPKTIVMNEDKTKINSVIVLWYEAKRELLEFLWSLEG